MNDVPSSSKGKGRACAMRVRSEGTSSRRRFLGSCATGLTALTAGNLLAREVAKAKVRLVFTHIPSDRPIWPNIGYDFRRRKMELIKRLAESCPNIEFLPVTVRNRDEAGKILRDDAGVDGYLVYMLGLWTGAPQVIAASGRPTIFVDDLYGGSGEFLIAYAAARRAGRSVVGVSSSRFSDVAAAVRCFSTLKEPGKGKDDFLRACERARRKGLEPSRELACAEDAVGAIDIGRSTEKLRASTLLVVGRNPGRAGGTIEEVFGTEVVPIDFPELDEAYEKADREEAAGWAGRWIREAAKVIEPTREEIEKSAAMYLAMRELLERHGAQGIAINCLGGFYGGRIKAYPCLGFCQLNNDGGVGACEADLHSAITMLAIGDLVGRPGFISDPVIDTSENRIIYAHCVAATRVFGPRGRANPYHIRNHSEDRKGASIRSLMPLGYMTSTLKFHPGRREVIFHQGKSVENVDEDMACRTKLAVEVKGDIDKLMTEWDRWGWHRVTFYGDLKAAVREVCRALGIAMIEEA